MARSDLSHGDRLMSSLVSGRGHMKWFVESFVIIFVASLFRYLYYHRPHYVYYFFEHGFGKL